MMSRGDSRELMFQKMVHFVQDLQKQDNAEASGALTLLEEGLRLRDSTKAAAGTVAVSRVAQQYGFTVRTAGAVQPLPDAMHYNADNLNRAAVLAFTGMRQWRTANDGLSVGMAFKFKNLEVSVGFPAGSQDLWEWLMKRGIPTVKAHYALWGRWYENSGNKGESIVLFLDQFCSDMGYKRHCKGGFRPEQKREAMQLLEALVQVEIRAIFEHGTKQRRLRGRLWERGVVAEEKDTYTDLFGASRVGDPNWWDPLGFTYRPGEFFNDPEWQARNSFVGKIGSGLMRLENDKDQWAILIGGFLGTMNRTNQYRPLRLVAETILKQANLAQDPDEMRRAARYQDKFERALDRLQEVGVVRSWEWADSSAEDIEDPDDPTAIAQYYAPQPGKANAWRNRRVVIDMGMEADRKRLAEGNAKQLSPGRR